jgi:protoheme IX farnesyltransferase
MQRKVGHPVAALQPWMHLIKIPLCVPIACSAGFGFILHTPTLAPSLGAVLFGVFFLSCGAAGFNSLQEASADRHLIRTRNRPLVTGRLTERGAAGFSFLLVVLGCLALLLSAENGQPLLLGLAALVLYNGVYTPLKKISIFAVFPGGLAGAIPPLIGWNASGGLLDDSRACLLLALFFLWQIPHFCMILLYHQEDYRLVHQPTLIRFLPEQSLKRITLVWILAFSVVALSLPLYPDLLNTGSRLTMVLMAGVMVSLCLPLFLNKNAAIYRLLFFIFNGAFFSAMLLVAILQLLAAQ